VLGQRTLLQRNGWSTAGPWLGYVVERTFRNNDRWQVPLSTGYAPIGYQDLWLQQFSPTQMGLLVQNRTFDPSCLSLSHPRIASVTGEGTRHKASAGWIPHAGSRRCSFPATPPPLPTEILLNRTAALLYVCLTCTSFRIASTKNRGAGNLHMEARTILSCLCD